tara:strand:+ start:247 stop:423 length:177 start_codon:yes stop_codon:yes gene_type:complete
VTATENFDYALAFFTGSCHWAISLFSKTLLLVPFSFAPAQKYGVIQNKELAKLKIILR